MVRVTSLAARIAFAIALAAGFGTDVNATQSGLCPLGGGIKLWTVSDDRNVFEPPSDLLRLIRCVEVGGGPAFFNAPTSSFLGVRNILTGARSDDFLRGNFGDTGGVFGGSVTFGNFYNIVGAPTGSITIGGSYASFSQSSFIGFADPGANNLNIFGTGVDPFGPGFTVPPGTGTFNDVFDNRYSRDVQRFDVFGQYNMPLLATANGISVAALARVSYTRTDIDERQSAEVRNIPLHIDNAVDFGVNTFTPGLGFQVVAPVNNFFSVHAYGWAGAAFSDASGNDRFATSGLFNVLQQNNVSDSHIGFAAGVGGGVSIDLGGGFGASATVSYLTTDSHPIISRTGEAGERSRTEWDNSDQLQVFFSTWLKFGR